VVSEDDARRAVAAELRALAELLATRDVAAARLGDLARRLEVLRSELASEPPRARWYEADPTDRVASRTYHDAFGPLRGEASVVAPPLRFNTASRGSEGIVTASARCGILHEGPPGLVHGGIVAACFDEVLAVSMRDAGIHAFATELTVGYRGGVPIDADLEFRAWIVSDDGRVARGRAECRVVTNRRGREDPEVRAEAEATFTRARRVGS
jgi:acyl-coenzyme A thioesterase PaaI-like protein